MLKSIRLVNFYSFKDTTIELNGGVNILVGINGSGKSNFFRLFELLNEAIKGHGLRRYILGVGGINEILYQGERHKDEIVLTFTYESIQDINYELKIIPTQTEYYLKERVWNSKQIFFENENHLELSFNSAVNISDFVTAIKSLSYITFIDTTLQSLLRKPVLSVPETELFNGGGNLVQVLSTLKTNDKKTYKRVVDALRSVNPHFRDFDFRPFGTNFEMLLEEDGLNRSIHLSKVSDGTLRYLCLITALVTNKKSILCIDEPETGLHPDMLYNIAEAIKEAGETSTVIISTHSTQLLNYFDLESVRVFEKDEQNATQIYAYSEDDFKGWYETFQVGTMWRQGDIGGNRYGN